MRRLILIAVLGLIGAAQGGEIVRVATLNLWHSGADLHERTERAISLLAQLKPDAVGLQEVSGSIWRRNRAALLAETLGYHHIYQASDGLKLVFQEGLGILTKQPLIQSRRTKLPHSHPWPFEARYVQCAELRLPSGQPFILLNTHLTHRNSDSSQVDRLDQALRVIEFAASQALARDIPAVLVGDLNSLPSHWATQAMSGTLLGGPPPFRDAWVTAGQGAGATISPDNPYKEDDSEPARIDYVMVLQGTTLTPIPLRVWRLGDAETAFSDHYGIAVELELISPGPGAAGLAPPHAPNLPSRPGRTREDAAWIQARVRTLRESIDRIRDEAAAAHARLTPDELRRHILEKVEARLRDWPVQPDPRNSMLRGG